jgi:hypothetical protein
VDFKPFLVGLLLLVGGLVLAVFGPIYAQASVETHEIGTLIPESTFIVGDVREFNAYVQKGVAVTITFHSQTATDGGPAQINFLVFDESSYSAWAKGNNAKAILSRLRVSSLNETLKAPETGAYYFVFDNKEFLDKKRVVFESKFDRVVYVWQPDERVTYAAYGVLILGGLIAAYGIVHKPTIPWA